VNVAVNHYVTDIDPLTWATAFEAALTADTRPAL
jgi:hypothetical protein